MTHQQHAPLIIYVNGMDNIKEAENHFFGQALSKNGFNFLAFDGPGQAELWKDLKFDLNYYESVSTIIDWLFEHNEQYKINLEKIATVGFSLGGHLAPLSAAHDKRICCTVGNSGFAQIGGIEGAKKLNPIWQRGINFMTGFDNFEEAEMKLLIESVNKAMIVDGNGTILNGNTNIFDIAIEEELLGYLNK